LLTISPGTQQFRAYQNKIDRKHVDFVLCTSDDLAPVLAVELDDGSHERRDRRARDAFVDRALDIAGLPILRVPAQRGYAPGELRGLIEAKLTGQPTRDVVDEVYL
jgi:very-short-patch-repair endonuclease